MVHFCIFVLNITHFGQCSCLLYRKEQQEYKKKSYKLEITWAHDELSSEKYLYLIGVRVLMAGQAWIVERMWRNVLPLPAWTEHIVWSLMSQGSSPAPACPSLLASSVNRPTTPATCSITPACTTLPAVPSQMEPPSVFAQSVRYSNPTASYLLTHPPAVCTRQICHSLGFMFTLL